MCVFVPFLFFSSSFTLLNADCYIHELPVLSFFFFFQYTIELLSPLSQINDQNEIYWFYVNGRKVIAMYGYIYFLIKAALTSLS